MSERCPICGTSLSRVKEPLELDIKGRRFVFCTPECLAIFQQFPEAYSEGVDPDVSPVEELSLI